MILYVLCVGGVPCILDWDPAVVISTRAIAIVDSNHKPWDLPAS